MKKGVAGVYKIRNIQTGKVYIGSSKNLKNRIRDHRIALKNNQNSPYLQRAYNKYGKANFEFKVLLRCDAQRAVLLVHEQHFIDIYDATNPKYGYNLVPIAGSNLGHKHNNQARTNMSNAQKGKKHTAETIEKMKGRAPWNKGGTGVYNKETLTKIGAASKGNQNLLGFKFSDESKKKMSDSHKGHTPWNKGLKGVQTAWNKGKRWSDTVKKKLSEAHKGYVMPEDQKQNISKALKLYWARKAGEAKNDTLS